MPKPSKISVLLVEDHSIVRQGLKSVLEAGGDIEVVGEATDGKEALRKAKAIQPKVVVMDIAMPGMNGLDAARRLAEILPETKVLILSSYSEPQEVERALEAGAMGYVMKETASSEVVKAVRETSKGNAYFSAAISQRMLQHTRSSFVQGSRRPLHAPKLTVRETEVLRLISQGRANKQIAEELTISIKTVEKHRQSLMNKLNIHEAAGLTRYAVSEGLVTSTRPALAAVA
jgi:DNA-binding NarL/FixJ family response regulator